MERHPKSRFRVQPVLLQRKLNGISSPLRTDLAVSYGIPKLAISSPLSIFSKAIFLNNLDVREKWIISDFSLKNDKLDASYTYFHIFVASLGRSELESG